MTDSEAGSCVCAHVGGERETLVPTSTQVLHWLGPDSPFLDVDGTGRSIESKAVSVRLHHNRMH